MTSYDQDSNDFLFAGGSPAAKFPTPGTVVKGAIVSTRVTDQTDLNTGDVKRFTNGDAMKQLLVTLQTDERSADIDADDGQRTLYAKGGQGGMLEAIRKAARPHGGLHPGGVLAVKYTGDGQAKQRGFNPPKLYAAQYTPPAQSLDFADGGDDAPPF